MAKFSNLRVWQQARELLKLVSAATADMRAEGDLKSQMRRAAISVASNITEGAERSDREFCRFLTIALGSNAEVEAQVTIAGDLGLIDPVTVKAMLDHTDHIGKMIRRLVQHLQPSG
jgi:four helix bundle protein